MTVSFEWQDEAKGVKSRRLHGMEMVCAMSASQEIVDLHHRWCFAWGALTVTGAPRSFRDHLENGWLKLRYRAPIIAAELLSAGEKLTDWKFEYSSPDKAQLQAWLDESIVERSSSPSNIEFTKAILHDPSQTAVFVSGRPGIHIGRLYYGPGNSEGEYHILLAVPHSAADARAIFLCLQEVLAEMDADTSSLQWGNDMQNLTLPAGYEAGLRSDGDSPPKGIEEYMQNLQEEQQAMEPICTIPVQPLPNGAGFWAGSTTRFRRVTFPPSVTKAIHALCHRHETRFTYIIAGALAIAGADISPNKEKARFFSMSGQCPADIRHRIKRNFYVANAIVVQTPVAASMDLIRAAKQELETKGSGKESFWKVVQSLGSGWEVSKDSDMALAVHQELYMGLAGMLDSMQLSDILPPAITFSPLGKVDDYIQHSYACGGKQVSISNPLFGAHGAETPRLGLHMWSWKGELVISALMGDMHEDSMVETFLRDLAHYVNLAAELE